ncbi:unknown [Mycoplasma sp. CAG:776]|nr:unknown [Mycoplasma sp. CAG:776]
MDTLIDFLLNNYIWFLVISLILIFALIGYLVDASTNKEEKKKKVTPIAPIKEDKKITVHPSVEVYTNDEFDDPLIKDKNA